MNFYVFYLGMLKDTQLDENQVFEILQTKSGVIFARNQEDVEYLSGLRLMYGVDVTIDTYIAWAARRALSGKPQPMPEYQFSLEPIPH